MHHKSESKSSGSKMSTNKDRNHNYLNISFRYQNRTSKQLDTRQLQDNRFENLAQEKGNIEDGTVVMTISKGRVPIAIDCPCELERSRKF